MIRRLHNKVTMPHAGGLILALLLLLPMAAAATKAPDYNFDQLKQNLCSIVTFRDKFYDAAATGGHVWLVGYYGAILHLNGDDSTFERQNSGTDLPLFDVTFLDEQTGYIVGKRGIVLKTTDGGANWKRVREESETNLFGAHFIDADTGWAVGDFGTIVHTSDGGATWKNLSLEGADINFNSCYFLDAQSGYVVGEFESIYRTQDGGASWQEVTEKNLEGISLFNIFFKNSDEGLAVGQNGVFFRTFDGGMTWDRQKMATDDNLLNVSVIEGRFSVVGLRGLMVEESPDGALEINQKNRITDWLNCIVGVGAKAAIAAGDHGRILWSSGSNSQREWEILN